MGFKSMAADAMLGRLVTLGLSPQLANLIANVCTFPKGKRYPDGELCLLDRPAASDVVNDLERQLKEASARPGDPAESGIRLILWALWKLFGPEAGDAIGSAYMEQIADLKMRSDDRMMVQRALKYVDGGPSNEENSFVVAASIFAGSGDAQQVWDGVLLATPDRLVHLEWPYVNPLAMGSPTPPLTVLLADVETCRFLLPEDIPAGVSSSRVSFAASPAGQAPYMYLEVGDGRVQFLLPGAVADDLLSRYFRTKISTLIDRVSTAVS
ncbi:hypothetical protein ACETK3_18520 [Arthrobacter sp. E44]|uniref:hypothetical protein n=1 Tax=Arthrobacter sp. E44 TaxID=3341794 RepID=UPI0035A6E0F6